MFLVQIPGNPLSTGSTLQGAHGDISLDSVHYPQVVVHGYTNVVKGGCQCLLSYPIKLLVRAMKTVNTKHIKACMLC